MRGRGILRRVHRVFFALALAMVLPIGPGHAQTDPCGPPPGIAAVPPSAQPSGETIHAPERLDVWMDASASMQGYVTRNNNRVGDFPLGMLARQLPDVLSIHEVATRYHQFGEAQNRDIGPNAFRNAATRSFYQDRSINQQSHPWEPLQAAVDSGHAAIVLSDLFLDDGSVTGDTSAMIQPLNAMLRRGWSITVVGILSRFSGTVYDLPAVPNLALSDGWMPFYLLIVGPAAEAAWLTRMVREEILPLLATQPPAALGLERFAMARFGLRPTVGQITFDAVERAGGVELPPRREGIMPAPRLATWLDLPALRLRIDPESRWESETPLRLRVPLQVQAPPGVTVSVEPTQPRVQAWVSSIDPDSRLCPRDQQDNPWTAKDGAGLVADWHANKNTIAVDLLPPSPPIEMTFPRDRLGFARVTVPIASVEVSSTDADWMDRWGFPGATAAEARAAALERRFMPTLNLGQFKDSLARLDRLATSRRGSDGPGVAAVIDVLFVVED